jgi:hypothetical protein
MEMVGVVRLFVYRKYRLLEATEIWWVLELCRRVISVLPRGFEENVKRRVEARLIGMSQGCIRAPFAMNGNQVRIDRKSASPQRVIKDDP